MTISNPTPMKNPGDYITFSQAELLVKSAICQRDRLVIALLWRCGLRAMEIRRLKAKHYDVNEAVIIVEGKGNKSLRVPVEPELAEWLKQECSLKQPEEYIIPGRKGNGLGRTTVWKIVRDTAKLAGIDVTKSNRVLHPHCLRHSLAIWLINSGVPIPKIQQILRHSSLVPTTYYLQFSRKELAEDYLKAWQKERNTPISPQI